MIALGSVTLRKLEPTDAEELYRYRNDSSVRSLTSSLSSGFSRADVAAWVQWHATQTDELLLAIVDSDTDRCLGHVGLYQIDHRSRRAEFGILIGDETWQGNGIGRRVTEAMLAYAFNVLNLRRIWIEILASNRRSIAAYRRFGFEDEGVLRQHEFRDGQYVDCVMLAIFRPDRALKGQ